MGALLEQPDPLTNFTDTPRRSLIESLRQAHTLQVIAEMKRASPSKGLIAGGQTQLHKHKSMHEQGQQLFRS